MITRTGCDLGNLATDDVLVGTLSAPPPGASSDLEIHLSLHRRPGTAAIIHAHPAGTVPNGSSEGKPHGVYAQGRTLEHALASMEHALGAETEGDGDSNRRTIVAPFAAASHSWFVSGSDESVELSVLILDQTMLPSTVRRRICRSVDDVADAIRSLAVRGAPLLGITAGLGVALAAELASDLGEDPVEAATRAGELLIETRPTAVNIRWAVRRTLAKARSTHDDRSFAETVLDEVHAIEREDAAACSAMGWLGAELLPRGANVLTHCNTGMLCTAGIGTAMGVIWCAHIAQKDIHVWVDETRPALQGARLTTWELDRLGVPFTLIPDSAAASLMSMSWPYCCFSR